MNQAFIYFCIEHGLLHHLFVPHTPQQNGVAKRKDRTLWEMENCMIQSWDMQYSFQAKEINYANYIQNWMSHKALQHLTPKEAWTHVKSDVSTFYIFSSKAWAFILDTQ